MKKSTQEPSVLYTRVYTCRAAPSVRQCDRGPPTPNHREQRRGMAAGKGYQVETIKIITKKITKLIYFKNSIYKMDNTLISGINSFKAMR
jgi:hypothetical protein